MELGIQEEEDEEEEEEKFLNLTLSLSVGSTTTDHQTNQYKYNNRKRKSSTPPSLPLTTTTTSTSTSACSSSNHHCSTSHDHSTDHNKESTTGRSSEVEIHDLILKAREKATVLNQENHNNNHRRLPHDHHHEEQLPVLVDRDYKKRRLQLTHVILKSAAAAASSLHHNNRDNNINSISSTANLIINLYQNSSQTGDSSQRVAFYFADGLLARLLQVLHQSTTIIKQPTTTSPVEKFLAFTHLYKVSPCYQFTHFTANQAILEAFEREEPRNKGELHVIDLDLSYGFQWPSLMQSLSEKAVTLTNSSSNISLIITGFAGSSEELTETETRLESFSKGFRNIVFRFQGLLRDSSHTILNHLLTKKRKYETLAVNLVSRIPTLDDSVLKITDMLRAIGSMNPSIVALVQREGDIHDDQPMSSSPKFLSSFMENQRFYSAMFDSLDDYLPRDSVERMSIERDHFGREIKQALVSYCEEEEEKDAMNCDGYESLERWKGRMERYGFCGLELSSRTIMQAKLLLRMRSTQSYDQPAGMIEGGGGGFRVFERDGGRAVSIGWQDKILLTVTSWQCI